VSVENLCDLLFELSSAERINIMLTLGGERLKLSQVLDRRTLPEVKMRIMVTDKMALVCFPYSNGSIDYAPFHGSDPRFHRWVKDLYEHHWVNAKPSSSTLLTPDA
jgi:hypothetical protein